MIAKVSKKCRAKVEMFLPAPAFVSSKIAGTYLRTGESVSLSVRPSLAWRLLATRWQWEATSMPAGRSLRPLPWCSIRPHSHTFRSTPNFQSQSNSFSCILLHFCRRLRWLSLSLTYNPHYFSLSPFPIGRDVFILILMVVLTHIFFDRIGFLTISLDDQVCFLSSCKFFCNTFYFYYAEMVPKVNFLIASQSEQACFHSSQGHICRRPCNRSG